MRISDWSSDVCSSDLILRHKSDVDASGRALSDIAEVALRGLYGPVVEDLARAHGHLAGSGLAVVALGKLGRREMTVSLDLDLVFISDLSPEGPLDRNICWRDKIVTVRGHLTASHTLI